MNLFLLSLNYVKSRPLNTALNVLLLALGMGIIIILLLLSTQLKEKITRNSNGIDLVVGAKGSPMQIILSSIFQIDYPTGNIELEEAAKIIRNRFVEKAIPMAMGDSYRTVRIIGTSYDYLELYGLESVVGKIWEEPFEVCLGSAAAVQLGLEIGDEFFSQHGMAAGGHAHDENPFKVVGIFEPSNSVADNLILTSIRSIWLVHHHPAENVDKTTQKSLADESTNVLAQPAAYLEDGDKADIQNEHDHKEAKHHHEENEDHHNKAHLHETLFAGYDESDVNTLLSEEFHDQEITSLLVKYRSPMAAIQLPRYVNSKTAMQSASPVFETARLFSMMGMGIKMVQGLAYLIIFISVLSIFIALYNELKQRKYDLAIMRSLGASRIKLFLHVILEGVMITFMGVLLAFALGHGTLELLRYVLPGQDSTQFTGLVFIKEEYWVLAGSILLGCLASLIPAINAYRTDISKVLAKG